MASLSLLLQCIEASKSISANGRMKCGIMEDAICRFFFLDGEKILEMQEQDGRHHTRDGAVKERILRRAAEVLREHLSHPRKLRFREMLEDWQEGC